MSKRILTLLAMALMLSLLPGCNLIYKQNIQQGNALDQDDLDQLRLGMSMNQVAFLLGTPAVQDPFHHDRWDYLSSYSLRGGKPKTRTVTLLFEDGALVSMTGIEPEGGRPEGETDGDARVAGTDAAVSTNAEESAPEEQGAADVTPAAVPRATVKSFESVPGETPEPALPDGTPDIGPTDRTANDAVAEMATIETLPEEAAEAPAPRPVVVSTWSIQLGAFDSEENARRVLERLNAAGYPAVIETQQSQRSGVRYLVRQHEISSNGEALRLLEAIDEALGIDGFVIPPES